MMKFTPEELERFVERTRRESGVPRYIEDPAAIEVLAELLRRPLETVENREQPWRTVRSR